jgi:hypothetical protein
MFNNKKFFHLLLIIITIINFSLNSSTNEEEIFVSDCGNKTITNPSKNDCYNSPSNNDEFLCCHLTGIMGIEERSACVYLENNSSIRINKIKEINQFATKVNLDCGIEKEIKSDCGKNNPKNEKDCELNSNDNNNNNQCCLIDIKTDKKNYKFCKKFDKKLDINTIGQAVVAANTIKAKLIVDCFTNKIKINKILLLLLIIIFL